MYGVTEQRVRTIDYSGLPESLRDETRMYLEYRVPMGRFLTAVAENNLMQAVMRADPDSVVAMREIVYWWVGNVTSDFWGSPENVTAWLARREKR